MVTGWAQSVFVHQKCPPKIKTHRPQSTRKFVLVAVAGMMINRRKEVARKRKMHACQAGAHPVKLQFLAVCDSALLCAVFVALLCHPA